jgi:hypothetical protein
LEFYMKVCWAVPNHLVVAEVCIGSLPTLVT